MYEKRIVRQVGHLQELYRDARPAKHKIQNRIVLIITVVVFDWIVFGLIGLR